MNLAQEIQQVLTGGSEEEKEILALAIQAIKQKREKKSAYLSGFLGLSGRFVEEDVYEFRVPITPFMMNRLGMVHGGVTATLADSTMGSLINKCLPEGFGAVTAEMKINYLKPGRGKMLISRAKLVQKGQTLAVLTCEIMNEQGTRICLATGTFYLFKRK
jgi:uncharacterized protein (TIGR00369 family)